MIRNLGGCGYTVTIYLQPFCITAARRRGDGGSGRFEVVLGPAQRTLIETIQEQVKIQHNINYEDRAHQSNDELTAERIISIEDKRNRTGGRLCRTLCSNIIALVPQNMTCSTK